MQNKRIVDIIRCVLLALLVYGQSLAVRGQNVGLEWGTTTGGNSEDYCYGMVIDDSGNVYSTGVVWLTVDFDPGPGIFNIYSWINGTDAFIQKLDSAGNFVWALSITGPRSTSSSGIAIDEAGYLYMTGVFYETVDFDPGPGVFNMTASAVRNSYILKLDRNGNFVWARSFAGGFQGSDESQAICVDKNGGVYITGAYGGTIDFDPSLATYNLSSATPMNDIFVVKLDSSGDFQWAQTYGDTLTDNGKSIEADALGAIYVSGTFERTVDFDPNGSNFSMTSNGLEDIFVLKLDTSGNFIWANSLGGPEDDSMSEIAIDLSGNVYLTGGFQDTADFDPGPATFEMTSNGINDAYIQKLDPNGNLLWAQSRGAASWDYAASITTDSANNVYFTGSFGNLVDFDPGLDTFDLLADPHGDVFYQKLDSAGNFRWAYSFGEYGFEEAKVIRIDDLGNTLLTGNYNNTLDFDHSAGVYNMTALDLDDIFLIKLKPCSPNTGIETISACDSITWYDGNTYAENNNTATYAFANVSGCDSIVTLNLTLTNSTFGTSTITACDSITWIDGITYTTDNNIATHALMNSIGCDSIITLNLSINNSQATVDAISTCDSLTWLDGNTYTSDNNSTTYTYTSTTGCDSIVTLNLTIGNSSGVDVVSACDSFTWIDGNTYATDNTVATHTLINSLGCDSIVALDLTIDTVNSGVTNNAPTLTANLSGAQYQWIDCFDMSPISGATGQSYTALINGNYAVVVIDENCVDTSACEPVSGIGYDQLSIDGEAAIAYPNPTTGQCSVRFKKSISNGSIRIVDVLGNEALALYGVSGNSVELDATTLSPGTYIIQIESSGQRSTLELIIIR
jgi:hypothetical protein